MSDLDDMINRNLAEDPEFRKEWERLGPLYSVISDVLRLRYEKGLSQADLAARMGKQQPAVARFEAGNSENPTLGFLQQLADALDSRLTIHLEPKAAVRKRARRVAERPSSYSPS